MSKQKAVKFKDVKVGQRFTRREYAPGVVDEKIEPVMADNGKFMLTFKEVNPPTGILGGWLKDNDEVILLEDK